MGKKTRLDEDTTRDLSIKIMDMLVDEFGLFKIKGKKEEDWYPFEIQDGITEILEKELGK